MYIASPMQEDDDGCSDGDDAYNDQNVTDNNGYAAMDDDEASDDSMASDASSGPLHKYKRENDHGSHGAASFKHDKTDKFNHFSSVTKPNKNEKKSDEDSARRDRKLASNRKFGK